MSPKARTVLLAGATGLVGRHCLDELLADPGVARVVAPTRRPLGVTHPKLDNPVVDFDALEKALEGRTFDQAICCLGTTIKQAGSREAFRRVDHDYPLALGRAARAGGATHYLVVTALGSDERSLFFYNRVKGEVERGLRELGFGALTIVRPSLLVGERSDLRFGERIATPFGRLLPAKWKAVDGSTVAKALRALAAEDAKGTRIVESAELQRYA
ncbi:MAG: oxidoreductase [Polyangiales bacterium]